MDDVPRLYLAPMQDVTNLPFWKVVHRRGGPDCYVTEYFRVHSNSKPERHILRSIDENPSGRPVVAQLIGRDPEALARTARELGKHAIAGIDLNLGCPAPIVCSKQAGGALLRDPNLIQTLVGTLRPVVEGTLTVKTRVGYHGVEELEELLETFAQMPLDGLTLHGRTVKERYQSPVHTAALARAVDRLPFPVVANGSVVSVEAAEAMIRKTRASGLMIGRGAIRNPWLFQQIRDQGRGQNPFQPTLQDLGTYIGELYEEVAGDARDFQEHGHVQRMKRYLNYIGSGISAGAFLYEIRRVEDEKSFHAVCARHLDSSELLPLLPHADGRHFCGFQELLSPSLGSA